MPVTKTAKRALRGSIKKASVNKSITVGLEGAIRIAKKSGKEADLSRVFSLLDRAVKKSVIHKNKASRTKSRLTALIAKKTITKKTVKKTPKKTSKK